MIDPRSLRLSDLHGIARLGVDATSGLTDVVEAMHAAIARPTWACAVRPRRVRPGLPGWSIAASAG
jgi:hypothetical protein